MAIIAVEHFEVTRTWTWAFLLGFAAPALLRSRFEALPTGKTAVAGVINFNLAVEAVNDFFDFYIAQDVAYDRLVRAKELHDLGQSSRLDIEKLKSWVFRHLENDQSEILKRLLEDESQEDISTTLIVFLETNKYTELLNHLQKNMGEFTKPEAPS